MFVAIKKIKMNAFNEREGIPFSALREIKLLQKYKHANIIGLTDVFYVNKTIYIALEIMQTDLSKILMDQKIDLKDDAIKCLMY